MARKCDTAKYRKRRKRERLNAVARIHRIKAMEAQQRTEVQERRRRAEIARLANPRRQLVQRLVNILYARYANDPFYRMTEIARIFGVDTEGILDAVVSQPLTKRGGASPSK